MMQSQYDVAVIGGGPAGLAAAVAAVEEGARNVVIIERDFCLGGILEQCIHVGFGLKYFGEELTGPEYAQHFIQMTRNLGISVLLNTMVLEVDPAARKIQGVNPQMGSLEIEAKAIVLAMGCRERTRGALSIPGTRPAGIYTAGTAQRFLNVQNYMVGKRVVILGSGDIGMIMARRITLEGGKVEGVVEILPYLAGLTRNRVQCLDDFEIPLYLEHTITDIKGTGRVSSVSVARVDEHRTPILSAQWEIPCDTVLLSVGLIPENELTKKCGIRMHPVTGGPLVDHRMQTSVPGIFACGNVVHVNDLVDHVSRESGTAGTYAARFAAKGPFPQNHCITVKAGAGVRYVVPGRISTEDGQETELYLRVQEPVKNMSLCISAGEEVLARQNKDCFNPGEMEGIPVPVDKLRAMKSTEITVSLMPAGEKEG